MANKTLELSIKIAGKMDKSLTAAIDSSQSKLGSLTKSISNIGTIGLAAMGTLATGTLATIAACTKEAAKFENYMSDVVKVVDGMADETGKASQKLADNGKTFAENYAAMEERLKDLSTQIPYTFEDLTRLAAAAGQSGKSFEDLMETDFLRDIAMWGTAMDISADQAGDWGAKWEQAFQMNHEQIMEVADVINYLGNNYATTAAEIAQSVNDAASMGQLAGVDVKATAAIAASMQAMGVSTDRVGTSIKRIYTNITKGSTATAAQAEAFERLGFTATGVAEAMQTDGVGTLLDVFDAVNNLPDAEKLSTLNALFGQWAIEGGAKVTQNLTLLTGMLEEISDPNLWTGSMEKEFIIKATTPEAIETMLSNTRLALMDDIGTAFLPAYKEFGLSMIDFLKNVRANMPELEQLANTLGALASNWVKDFGNALDEALPHIQRGLDYLLNNGDQVAKIVGGLAAAFAAMKFAPVIEGLFGGVGSLLFGGTAAAGGKKSGGLLGGIAGLYTGGQKAASIAKTQGGAVWNAAKMGAMEYAANGQNSIQGGAVGIAAAMQNLGGLFSGKKKTAQAAANSVFSTVRTGANSGTTVLGMAKSGIANSAVGQYFGGIRTAAKGVANTAIGGGILNGVKATGGVSKEILAGIAGPEGLGLTTLANGALGFARSGAGALTNRAGNAATIIANSGVGRTAGGLATAAGGIAGKVAGVGSGVLGALGSFASAGTGLLGSVWGPVAGGFASLFAGAAPVIAAISGIIAVVSILGDHLEDIRTIVGNVFGDTGLAVFDGFIGKLQMVGDFVTGLFADGGVASALAPVQNAITNMFGADAGAAFGGLTTVLQSVMGVVEQIVTFSTGTVKPIIQNVFSFITETVMPVILQTFTAAAPTIAAIISNIGTAVMTGMQIIGSAIRTVMPIVQGVISAIMTVGSVAIPAVLAGFQVFSEGINSIMTSIQGIFQGLITFITGVFTGNWSAAWEGVKQIFGNAFAALVDLCKTPINAVIALINKAVDGINSLFGGGITIPDWVPEAFGGGKTFSLSLPHLPMLANGGFTNGTSIAGEAGTEAVISFRSGVRNSNIATWMQAGQMLGVSARQAIAAAGSGSFAELKALAGTNEVELKEIGGGDKGNNPDAGDGNNAPGQFVFAPQITVQGNADRAMMESVMADMKQQFEAWYEQMQRRRVRTAY
ncbi:phage tail tape measure protein [Gemmiger sp. An87]|nr:phage tail tape measure protein [Gemmiger sp. An87]